MFAQLETCKRSEINNRKETPGAPEVHIWNAVERLLLNKTKSSSTGQVQGILFKILLSVFGYARDPEESCLNGYISYPVDNWGYFLPLNEVFGAGHFSFNDCSSAFIIKTAKELQK